MTHQTTRLLEHCPTLTAVRVRPERQDAVLSKKSRQVSVASRWTNRGASQNPQKSRSEGDRRARAAIASWCVANRVDWLGGLTFRPEDLPADEAEAWSRVAEFRRNLRSRGITRPVLVVISIGSGHRLHFHVAYKGRIAQRVLEACWPWGFARARHKPSRGRNADVKRALSIARYLAKAIAESDLRSVDGRRYTTTRGSARETFMRFTVSGWGNAIDAAAKALGGPVREGWKSKYIKGWTGPPCVQLVLL